MTLEGIIQASPKDRKKSITITITTADNGFILESWGRPDDEFVKLVFTSRPKLMKAVGKFLDYDETTAEEGEE